MNAQEPGRLLLGRSTMTIMDVVVVPPSSIRFARFASSSSGRSSPLTPSAPSAALSIALLLASTSACSRTSSTDATSSDDAGRATSTTPSPSRVGSCDRVVATGTCSEYTGTYLAQNEVLLTSTCAKLGGTWVYAECPNTSVVGKCTLSTTEVRKFYGTGAASYEPDKAKTECETSFRGTWQVHR